MARSSSHRAPQVSCLVLLLIVLLATSLASCAPASPAVPTDPPVTPTNTPTPSPPLPPKKATPDDGTPLQTPAPRAYPIVLEGHTDRIYTVEYSPDGSRLVTASDDNTAIVWDIGAAAPVTILRGHTNRLTTAHFSANGARVVTAGFDAAARVWNAGTGKLVAVLEGHTGIVNDARYCPSGGNVVTAGEDGTARIWKTLTGEPIHLLNAEAGPVKAAVFSSDGFEVATAHDDGTVVLWNADDGSERLRPDKGLPDGAISNMATLDLAYSADGTRLFGVGEDGALFIWNVSDGSLVERIAALDRGVMWMDVSADGTKVAMASMLGGYAGVWDVPTGRSLTGQHLLGTTSDVAISPDGSMFTAIGAHPEVRVWPTDGGRLIAQLREHADAVICADFSPDSRELATADEGGTVIVWGVSADAGTAVGERAPLSPDGPWWVGAGPGGLWAANADGTMATTVTDYEFEANLDISGWAAPAGGRLAYVTSEDNAYHAMLHIVKLPDFQEEAAIPLTTDATEPARDAAAGNPELDAVSVVLRDDSLAWSPDGRWLAFNAMIEGPTSDLYVYDTADGEVTRLTDGPTQAAQPLWSPVGAQILHTALAGKNIDTGMHVQAFWTADPEGGDVRLVNEGEDVMLGWINATEFAIHSIDTLCGRRGLRVRDPGGTDRVIWEGYFDQVAVSRGAGVALVAVWEETATCDGDLGAGIYVVGTDGSAPLPVVEDKATELAWSDEAWLFFVATEAGTLAVAPSGDFIDLAVPEEAFRFPEVAAGSKALAWHGNGAWLSNLTSGIDDPPRQISTVRALRSQWSPDGSRLLYITADEMIHSALAPDYVPVSAGTTPFTTDTAWVMP